MRNRFALFIFCLHLCCLLSGMPAYPGKIKIKVNGHEQFIRLLGDEYNKRAETEDGYTIIQNEQQQWCYAKMGIDSTIISSRWTLGENESNKEFIEFLKTTPKHLKLPNKVRETNLGSNKNIKSAIGERKILVILMEYQDLNFIKKQSDFERLFNEENYNEDNAQGSVKDYYLSVSYDQLQLESDVYGPFKALHDMAYYGKNSGKNNGQDVNAYYLFEEAIVAVAQDVDLSLYDGDNDGYIDNVHIIFAGYGEEAGASSNAIWSHEATFYRPYEIQGLKIDRYSCAPELRDNSGNGISRIGPHCHEIGHALGAMDYYDTNYSTGGDYLGTGKWDIMAAGSWNNDGITPADFNPYVKAYNYGWISPKVLPAGEVIIPPSCMTSEGYYILKTSEYSDFYLIENRSKGKWGMALPGEGLLIYHIHYDIANANNEINATAPQMCYIVCASSKSRQPNNSPASYGDINSNGCPFPGSSDNRDFGQNSTPIAFFWSKEVCSIELNNISLNGDGSITLTNNSFGADYEPVERITIYFEGFEDNKNIKVNELMGSMWQIVDNPENTMTFIDKPIAYEGVKSLQLSAIGSDTELTDKFEFTCMPVGMGKMRVKISVASLKLRFNKPNLIRVGYRTNDNPDWQFVEIQSAENNHWRQSFVDFPDKTDGHFIIIGTAYAGSIIAIDNVEVEQDIVKEDVGITVLNTCRQNDRKENYITLNGICYKKPTKGFNVYIREDKKKNIIIK